MPFAAHVSDECAQCAALGWVRRCKRLGRLAMRGIVLVMATWTTGMALAEPRASDGVYTCTDAQGRQRTSDRPIPECADREQRVLSPSGTLRKIVGPSLTEQQMQEQEAREKAAQQERARRDEQRRRDKALLVRYPDEAAHDKSRREALAQVQVRSDAARDRLAELAQQRRKLDEEMEFYRKNPERAPALLRSQVEQHQRMVAQQERVLADQARQVEQVNQRFDEELKYLRSLWSASVAPASAPVTSAAARGAQR